MIPKIAEHELAPAVQARLWLDPMDALAIGHAVNDLDVRGRLAATADSDVLECRVGGYDQIRHAVAHALKKQESAIHHSLLAKFDDKQFRRDVVLIEDELLAHELERQSGEKNKIGRIAGLDDRKPAFAVNLEQEAKFVNERGCVFAKVRKRAAPFRRQRMPVDRDVVDDLERFRKVGVGRADHRNCPAGAMKSLSLLPNSSVERNRQVFDDDDA